MHRLVNKQVAVSPGRWLPWMVLLGLLLPGLGWSHPSGLQLQLFPLKQSLEYSIHQPIELIGVVQNESQWPVNVNEEIKQIELEQYLIVTDPYGQKHLAGQEKLSPDMPPLFQWGQWETVPAAVINSEYERSISLTDLRLLFPIMGQLPGEYVIEATIPVSRFQYTVQTAAGLMGVLDDNAWQGTLTSNPIRMVVVPDQGARLQVRVEDLQSPDQPARYQVEVRLYQRSRLPFDEDDLSGMWQKVDPLARGKTDQDGWVILPTGASCLPKPEPGDAYMAVALYLGEYRAVVFEGEDEGWAPACGGRLERYLFFGEADQSFALFGLNSVRIQSRTRIASGDVGVQNQCRPCPSPGYEVVMDMGVRMAGGSAVMGDSVKIGRLSSVWNVHCNEISSRGRIRGEVITPLSLPVWPNPPEFKEASASNKSRDDRRVRYRGHMTLSPGTYRNITVGGFAKLFLNPGVYHMQKLSLGLRSQVICRGKVEVRIKESLKSPYMKAFIGIRETNGFEQNAEDAVFYVGGSSSSVVIGPRNHIEASIYAPRGQLTTNRWCRLNGSFIARNIDIGRGNVIRYDGPFATEQSGSDL